MNRMIQRILFGTVSVFSAALIVFLPNELALLGFLGRDFEPNDWILHLFTATLILPVWGICIYALYRECAPKLLTLTGWLIPLGILIFYARMTGTYRAGVLAITVTSLMVAGNGLGQASRSKEQQPLAALWIPAVIWIVIAGMAGRFCIMQAPMVYAAGVSLLILSGAHLYFRSGKRWMRLGVIVLALLQILGMGTLLSEYGFILEDCVVGIFIPLLALVYAYTESRWSRKA